MAFSTGSAERRLNFTGYVTAQCALLFFIVKKEKNILFGKPVREHRSVWLHAKFKAYLIVLHCRQSWIRCISTSLDFIWFKPTISTVCRAVLSEHMSSRRQSSLLSQRIRMKR